MGEERERASRESLQPELRAPEGDEVGWRRVELRAPRGTLRPDGSERRRDARLHAFLSVQTTWVDPVRDPVTREVCYQTCDDDLVLDLSRRGARLRCARPPDIGTRLLIELTPPDARGPLELIGRTCWTRVEFVPGEQGARASAAVGVELLGGARAALDRYESWLLRLHDASVATAGSLG